MVDAPRGRPDGPLVSIVIPCFNHARFVGEAIDSALHQAQASVEVVVVDDGSTDDSAAVAATRHGVRVIRQVNRGLSAARNVGLAAASGEYVVFLDADDRLLPHAVAAGLQALSTNASAAFAFGAYRFIDEAGHPTSIPTPAVWWGSPFEAMLRQS
ncbi:MAG: glycosyltransferase family 2 protein, partial [Cytophagaceae bacterium]|nr:glycosyltransferase family 2 protein [Gemmatimonadaceae bacterium]